MAKNNKSVRILYPGDRGDRVKDANNKLRSENRNLKKRIKKLEQENKTLKRAFDKSCEYINEKLFDKDVEEVINIVNGYDYKETKKGRKKLKTERESETEAEAEVESKESIENKKTCPKCNQKEGEGYGVIDFLKFKIHSCRCGYKERVNKSERDEGS